LGAAAWSVAGGLLSACEKRTAADVPALRVSTIGKGEGDMRLLQTAASIQPESFHVDYKTLSGQGI
jgi:hypothetical protein